MVVPVNDRRSGPYTCSGGEAALAYDFRLMRADDVAVWRRRGGVTARLVLGVDYQVTGVGNPAGGSVILSPVALVDDLYVVEGARTHARLTDIESGQTLARSLLNSEFDSLQVQHVELARDQGRALQRSRFDGAGGVELPPAVAGYRLGFDDDLNLAAFPPGEGGGGSVPDPLPVESGGTGGNTAEEARDNIGALGAEDVSGAVATDLAVNAAARRDNLGLGALAVRDDVGTPQIVDNAVTLAKLAHGTPSAMLGFDALGAPVEKPPFAATRVTGLARHAGCSGGAARAWIVDGTDVFVAGDSAILGLAVDVGVPRRVTFNVQPAVISKVVIGASAIYIIDANGRVYHLGGNGQGQGGHGDTVARSVATRVEWFVGQGVAITDVFPAPMTGGSENYVFFVGGNGKAYVAGANANGQHGMGDATARSTPAEVTALGSNVAGVVLSGNAGPHTLAWTSAGHLYGAGYNGQGQLGDGTTTARNAFVALSVTDAVKAVAFSDISGGLSGVVRGSGGLQLTGHNVRGSLGQGDTTSRTAWTTAIAAGVSDVVLAGRSVLARLGANVQTFGANPSGQLGSGGTADALSPITPAGAFQGHVTKVAGAGVDTGCCYIETDAGAIWAAGSGATGGVADGGGGDNTTFAAVLGVPDDLAGWQAYGASGAIGLGVMSAAGRAAASGDNANGELGLGSIGGHAFALTDVHLLNRSGPRGDLSAELTAIADAAMGYMDDAEDAADAAAGSAAAAAISASGAGVSAASSAANAATSSASAAAAQGWAGTASGYATTAGGAAGAAVAARDVAIAAASAAGPVAIYQTYAAADAATGLSAGDVVEVMIDETRANARTRYVVDGGGDLDYVLTLPRMIGVTPVRGPADHDDTASINAAMTAAGVGGVIALMPGVTYEISAELLPLQRQKIFGNGAIVKKRAQIVTTTTTAVTANVTTSVTLTDASAFRVGMQVAFAQQGVARTALVYGTTLSRTRKITAIAANVVTLDGAPDINAASGSTCFLAFASCNPLVSDVSIADVTFDGNRANWTYCRWEVIAEALAGSLTTNVIYDRCRFQEFPGEGVTLYGNASIVDKCYFKNGSGNGVHFSGCTGARVTSNQFEDLNLDTSIGHPDGAVAWSLGHSDCHVVGNVMLRCMAGVGGLDQALSSHAIIALNTIRDCVWFGVNLAGGISHITIDSNHIYNCGPTSGGTVPSPSGFNAGPDRGGIYFENVSGTDIVVKGNKIAGCSVYMSLHADARRTSVFDNVITGAMLISGHHAKFTGNLLTGTLRVGGAKNVRIAENVLYTPGNTTDAMLSIYATADYENVDVSHNQIVGGAYGVSIGSSVTALRNVSIDSNRLYDQTTRGISVDNTAAALAGLTANGNLVRVGPSAVAGYSAILAKPASITIAYNEISNLGGSAGSRVGINYAAAAGAGAGGVIKDNIIRGPWAAAIAMVANSGAWCINNVVDSGTVGSATGNTISGTVTI